MLVYKSDRRSLSIIVLHFSLLIWALWIPFGLVSLFLIPILTLTTYLCLNVNHNQIHLGIFSNRTANICTNVILSICSGMPVSVIYMPHRVNHHPNVCNENDWTGLHLAGHRQGLWRVVYYTIHAQINLVKMRPSSPFEGISDYRKKSLLLEILGLVTYVVVAFIFKTESFLVHNLIPWIVGTNILVFMNFFLHDKCDVKSEHHHSVNFTSKVLNYILLNGGYHLAHHEKPNLHWSELSKYHRENISGKIDSKYEQKSILKHFIRQYILY